MNNNEIERYNPSQRTNHWIVAILFVLAALSGLALFHPALFGLSGLFGGGTWTRILHPFIGVAMFVFFLWLAIRRTIRIGLVPKTAYIDTKHSVRIATSKTIHPPKTTTSSQSVLSPVLAKAYMFDLLAEPDRPQANSVTTMKCNANEYLNRFCNGLQLSAPARARART
ncbi:cytochrome b/b6 domain-containing protein [Methylobacterium organophilum]|nr:cytochrome b/b6 domain-containing protein [Methylobacterium organophilum]